MADSEISPSDILFRLREAMAFGMARYIDTAILRSVMTNTGNVYLSQEDNQLMVYNGSNWVNIWVDYDVQPLLDTSLVGNTPPETFINLYRQLEGKL